MSDDEDRAMNESGSAVGGAAARRPRSRLGTVGLSAIVVLIVGGLVTAAFALADSSNSGHGNPSASALSTGASTSPTTTASAASTSDAKPAVCGDVKGVTVMDNDMVMAPVPNRAPSASDEAAAQRLVASVNAGIAKYSNLSAAVAAGYVPATKPTGRVVHYANWSVVKAGDVLDTTRPSSLVYANTVSGPVLLGAMFLGAGPCQPGPDVAGPLTQWHAHANLCLSATHEVVGKSSASGACAVGTHNTNTFFMMHVWIAPSLAQNYQFAADVPRAAYAAIIRSGKA
jgi:hypothetical protein